ncbi:MBL fold metallo-hydrolase [Thermoflavimicrobium daqui]|jgi:glyoxylase-like metal-dependent hydrolase (beta-lactamase superfamily II)|uniref:MBL fold metallo-hydrolase n=1 Tax=Thermoflavimicrobium daqui TaxID=2137476 RepID=A0A364K540_9BACL|nr:MBL fold metallo-hydrolase [Thermoflavimicrobium daqui]RAL24485.1 MBL fold metallo-hydrolase [Thermoflavimicrobium daqui]
MVEKTVMKQVKWTLYYGGACLHPEKMMLSKGKWKKRLIPALFSLIEHPVHGPILFDTGYAKYFFMETDSLPYRLYRLITPVVFSEKNSAVHQLAQAGYHAKDIRCVILSHLHADHIAGCLDFPAATFICSRAAFQSIQGKSGLAALKQAFIPNLLPSDFSTRVQFIEDTPLRQMGKDFSPFTNGYDLFGDGTLITVMLPGHAVGQIGLFLRNLKGEMIFLAADSCWLEEQYQHYLLPNSLAYLITADVKAYKESLSKVHQLYIKHPDILIIPSHCLTTWQRVGEGQ